MAKLGGIYEITCDETGVVYIGSTSDFARRISHHFGKLRRGVHPCKPMQADFTTHGSKAFTVRLVEVVPDAVDLLAVENRHITNAWLAGRKLYNIRDAYGRALG
jgi:group I intron endonuclease